MGEVKYVEFDRYRNKFLPLQIQGISWDDGCFLCDSNACESNLYFAPKSQAKLFNTAFGDGNTCYKNDTICNTTSNECDLTVSLYEIFHVKYRSDNF